MKYEVTVQAISLGHVAVEADSPEKAEAAAMSKLFTGAIHWEFTRMEFPGVKGKKAHHSAKSDHHLCRHCLGGTSPVTG